MLILFDGVCNFCNSSVNFIIDHDPEKRFKFAAQQSHVGQQILLEHGLNTSNFHSIIFLKDGIIYQKTDAILEILYFLGSFWRIFYVFKLIPSFLRNPIYNFIAKNRYRLFGKTDTCRMPTPNLKERFLASFSFYARYNPLLLMKKNKTIPTVQVDEIIVQPVQTSSQKTTNQSYQIIDFVLLALLALVIVFLRSKFLKIPMERDEGAYILFGRQLLEGKIPYVDFFDNRLPMIFYAYGFVALFGTSLAQTATVFMVIQIITTCFIYWIAKNSMGKVGAFVAAFTYIFLSLAPSLNGFARQSEHFVNLFLVVGLYFLFQIKEIPNKKIIWAGVFLCLAMMVKHNAVTVLIFGGLYLLIEFYNPEKFLEQHLIKAILLFSGGVLVVIVILFGSIMLRGATNEMFYWAFVHSGLYASRIGFSDGLTLFENNMSRFLNEGYDVFFYASLLGLLLIWLTKISSKAKLQWSLLYVFTFLALVPGFQFYAHYFLMWVLLMAFFVGWAVVGLRDMIEEYIPQVPSKLQAIIPIILFIVGFIWHFSNLKQYYLTPKYTQILRNAYGANPFPESIEIADYLKQHTQKDEKLGIFGSEQQLFLYTDTKPASRHTFMYPILFDSTRTEKPSIWQKEYIREVEESKPNYFVRFDQGTSLLRDPKSPTLIFTWLDNYLNQNYERVGVVDIFSDGTIYKWDTEATNYKPQSTEVIYVMKRKGQ